MKIVHKVHKVLIVDDEAPARDFIAELVTLCLPNSEITKIGDSQSALPCLQQEHFDILFLDVCMPGMNGLEMLERVVKRPLTAIVSAHHEFDYASKGIDLGVMKYITKPLHEDKIQAVIREYFKRTKKATIEFKAPQGNILLEIDQILAVESFEHKKIKIFTPDLVISGVKCALNSLHELLPNNFQFIRRNCILNFHAISNYNLKSQEVDIICKNEKVTFKFSRENKKKMTDWVSHQSLVVSR